MGISEYGAAIWADPYRRIPEASRLRRSGGELVFLANSTLAMLCKPDYDDIGLTAQLLRPQFGMHRFTWPDDTITEFHLSHGDRIRLLRDCRFEIEELIELRAPEGSPDSTSSPPVPAAWARDWPCEEAWRARRRVG